MATISATISSVTFPAATAVSAQRRTRVKFIAGLNSFGGLKADNNVASLGLRVGTEQSFAKIVSLLKKKSSQGRGGGALTSTCNAVDEIFRIAAIMPALFLSGLPLDSCFFELKHSWRKNEKFGFLGWFEYCFLIQMEDALPS